MNTWDYDVEKDNEERLDAFLRESEDNDENEDDMTETTVISGAVINTASGIRFDLISKSGKVEVSQEFIENLEKTFEREFVEVDIELI